MDTAIDNMMTDPSVALDLANIRYQLMYEDLSLRAQSPCLYVAVDSKIQSLFI